MVDPLSLVGAGVNAGMGLLGYFLGADDRSKEYEQRKQALAQYMGISVPELETLVAKEQGATHLGGVRTDAAFDVAQDQAAQRLSEVGNAGGLDARARARMEQARMEAAQAERSSREGVLADARARGTLGSGAETSALLQAGQAAADRERMAGVQTLGDAEDRALQAIIQGGSLAAQRQATQWNQRAQVATAQDEIDRFNTATANDFTLQNANQRALHFQQQMQLAGAKSGALKDMANFYGNHAAQIGQAVGGAGQAIGYGLGAMGQAGVGGGGVSPQAAPVSARAATSYEAQNPAAIGSNAALTPALAQQGNRKKVR